MVNRNRISFFASIQAAASCISLAQTLIPMWARGFLVRKYCGEKYCDWGHFRGRSL